MTTRYQQCFGARKGGGRQHPGPPILPPVASRRIGLLPHEHLTRRRLWLGTDHGWLADHAATLGFGPHEQRDEKYFVTYPHVIDIAAERWQCAEEPFARYGGDERYAVYTIAARVSGA